MLVLLTALVVAAILGTTTADEEIPWINEVPLETENAIEIPFDEATQAVELKVKFGIVNVPFYWYRINLRGNDDEVKLGWAFNNPADTYWQGPLKGEPMPPTWGITPCESGSFAPSEKKLPLPENFVFSEEESIWTVWKDNGKLNVLYNGEDFLRDGYPGVSDEFDCETPNDFQDGTEQSWKPYWDAEIKSVSFNIFNKEKFDGYRIVTIPGKIVPEPENNDDSGDDSHDDDNGSYSGTTLLSCSSVIVTALLMAAFF